MLELLIGLFCCFGMAGSLYGYLKWYSKKYKDGKDPSSLSSTFYKTGWKFRVLLISFALWMIYPVLLANGSYIDGQWLYTAPNAWLAWGKLAYAISMAGIISVAFNAYGNTWENRPHVFSASIVASVGAGIGSLLHRQWYLAILIWLAWYIYYKIKNYKNNKAGNKDAWGLYIELVALYAVPSCLAVFMVLTYLL